MKKWTAVLLLMSLLSCICLPASAEEEKVLDGCVLVTFGASNTALSSWPSDVAKELNMYLVNSGIGGNDTSHGMARFQRDVLAHDPDFVTICFGTNDFNRQKTGEPQVTPEDYRANLVYFITELKKIDAVPILVTSPIIQEYACGGGSLYPQGTVNTGLDVYVNVVQELAAEYDVPLVDVHAMMDESYTADQVLVSDGVHLTELGNKVFTDGLVEYFRANYKNDPDAPRVEYPQPPEMEEPPFTASIIPFEPEKWREIYPDTVVMTKEQSGAISFANTTGEWPEAHYAPSMDQALPVPVRGSTLTVDIKLEAAMNMMLYFNGANPTTGYDGDYIPLNPILKATNPSLKMIGDDILGGQHIKCTLQLEEIIPKGMIDDEGNVVFSGVKLYVVGTAGKKITINKLEVTAVDPATLPPLPTYEYGADLMPTSPEKITPAQGVAGVEYHEDGSFTLFRDAKSSIAWPSVKVAVDKEIDLAATPLLHLEVFMNKGCANGHLYYTLADGNTGSVQLSQLVSGTVNDMTADTDIYVDLAAYLGTEEVITVNYLTLSVYGNVGDAITWKSIEAAKLIPVEIPPEVSEEESTETGEENSEAESSAAECSHEELSIDMEKLGKDGMGPWGWILLAGAALTAAAVAILFFRKKR
jgi:lysophospholipase L1-like esterase